MSRGRMSLEDNFALYHIPPALVDNTTADLGAAWIPTVNCIRAYVILTLGVIDITVDMAIQVATAVDGTGAVELTTAVEITQVAADGDGMIYAIDFDFEHFDLDPATYDYWSPVITVGDGSAGAYCAAVILVQERHMPISQSALVGEVIEAAG